MFIKFTEKRLTQKFYTGTLLMLFIMCVGMLFPAAALAAIAVPADVDADVTGDTSVRLSWSSVSGATGYKIYKSENGTTFSEAGEVSGTTTSYTAENLVRYRTYYFAVTALKDQEESTRTTVKVLLDAGRPTDPADLRLNGSQTAASIPLIWTGSRDDSNIIKYKLYSKKQNETEYKLLTTTDSNQYTVQNLLPKTSYFFYVYAVDGAGNTSANPTNTLIVDTLAAVADTQKPAAPKIWVAAVSTSKVKIIWSGATDNIGVTGYDLYRAVGSGGFSRIAGPDSSPYYDSGLSSNKTYKYYIRAKDAAGNTSDVSNIVTVITNGDTTKPTVPKNFSYSVISDSEVKLSWGAATDNRGVSGYKIYRAVDSGSYAFLAATSGTSYNNKGLNDNREYKYYVTAYDAAGNESDRTGIITVNGDTEAVEKTIDEDRDSYVILEDIMRIDVPSEAITKDTTFRLETGSFGEHSNSGYKTIGLPVKVTAKASGSKVTSFRDEIKITMYYTTSQLGSTKSSKLCIYYWDEANDVWAPLETTVSSSSKKATAMTDHLTVFALLADTTEPDKPTLKNSSSTDRRVITLSGNAEEYTEVEIELNGDEYETTANGKGSFSLEVMLKKGTNTIQLRSEDAVGNRSSWSKEYTIRCSPDYSVKDISGHWAEFNIQKGLEKGITNGYRDGTFKPDRTVTRSEFCKLVVLALGYKPVSSPHLSFKDRGSIPDWAEGYIARAVDKGLIDGYTDDTFRPNRQITREEMAVILIRAAGLEDEADDARNDGLDFRDAAQVQKWARGAVVIAVEKEIISGYPNDNFGPGRHASRAEAVTMLLKAEKIL